MLILLLRRLFCHYAGCRHEPGGAGREGEEGMCDQSRKGRSEVTAELHLHAQSGVLPSELPHHLCVLAGDDDLPVEPFEAVAELLQS